MQQADLPYAEITTLQLEAVVWCLLEDQTLLPTQGEGLQEDGVQGLPLAALLALLTMPCVRVKLQL